MEQFLSSYMGYIVLTGIASLVGMYVQGQLQRKFKKYGQMPIRSRLTGKEVAEQMLRYYGVHDVKIVPGKGMLTDHYNPATKTVSLSQPIYGQPTIMAAAVAAHECGHAVQHATAYPMLQMRSRLVPLVQVSASLQQYLLMAILLLASTNPTLLLISIIAFGITALFSIVTLPVEFDASKRALAWLDQTGTLSGAEYDGAKDALNWAAMTYVSAALAAVVSLLFVLLRYMNSRNR